MSDDDERPILSYASPHDIVPPGADPCVFEFQSPPVFLVLLFKLLTAAVFAAGAVAVAVQLRKLPGLRHPVTWVFPALVCAGCAFFAVQTALRARHLLRFGGQPTRMTLHGRQLILSAPSQWGPRVRTLPLEDIERCYAEFGGWTLSGPRLYRINLFIRGQETLELEVATRDNAAVDRAVLTVRARARAADADPADPDK